MTDTPTMTDRIRQERWLQLYYYTRTAFSVLWVGAAFSAGRHSPAAASILLVVYPLWDALANYVDAARSGGLAANRTQAINVAVSLATAVAVVLALRMGMNWVLGVFGAWAIFSGLLQLGTAIKRWKSFGAQRAMILSGAQSALAGSFFIAQARMQMPPTVSTVAGYALFGALYFFVSALWLSVSRRWASTQMP
jgi:uncharacterized membrane protein HdeD (DUF308 family)